MYKDLTGRRFGRLTVIEYSHIENSRTYWKCVCDCGNITTIQGHLLSTGKTKSCGCLNREKAAERMRNLGKRHWKNGLAEARKTENHGNYVHGKSNTRLYTIWTGMKQRCFNPNNRAYIDYGGRGITVCDEWKNDFQAFYDWAIKNGYADNLSIDRKDVNGNYEPSNCRWATDTEQQNNKSDNRIIEYKGESKTIRQWADEKGMSWTALHSRLKKGWSIEKALETPVRKTNTKKKP